MQLSCPPPPPLTWPARSPSGAYSPRESDGGRGQGARPGSARSLPRRGEWEVCVEPPGASLVLPHSPFLPEPRPALPEAHRGASSGLPGRPEPLWRQRLDFILFAVWTGPHHTRQWNPRHLPQPGRAKGGRTHLTTGVHRCARVGCGAQGRLRWPRIPRVGEAQVRHFAQTAARSSCFTLF